MSGDLFSIVSTLFHAMPADYLAFRHIHKTPSPGCRGSRLWRIFRTASIIPIHTISSPSSISSGGIRIFMGKFSHQWFKFQ